MWSTSLKFYAKRVNRVTLCKSKKTGRLLLLLCPTLDLDMVTRYPQKVIMKLIRLNILQPNQLVTYMDTVIELLPVMLDQDTPRKIQVLVNKLWLKINNVNPERLFFAPVLFFLLFSLLSFLFFVFLFLAWFLHNVRKICNC